MSTPGAELPLATRPPTGLLVASTLCWIWGILCGFTGLALLLPALSVPALKGAALIIAVVFTVFAVVYGVAGYLIRKGRVTGGWLGVVSAGIVSGLQLLERASGGSMSLGSLAGLALNVAIVLLLVLNWRHFRAGSRVDTR